LTIQEQFEDFDARHPDVKYEIARRAKRLRSVGWKHYGIHAIWEAMRYDRALHGTGDEYKLNDHFTSRYARLVMREWDELRGFFELRVLKAK
jgi:hypothetical protein